MAHEKISKKTGNIRKLKTEKIVKRDTKSVKAVQIKEKKKEMIKYSTIFFYFIITDKSF